MFNKGFFRSSVSHLNRRCCLWVKDQIVNVIIFPKTRSMLAHQSTVPMEPEQLKTHLLL
uniref:Uncharacterized protein n=1 Tax=Aegilops tauschii subsp. strangulata TaxID=200361 RepID=A0A453G3G3_AEGTS